MEYLKYLNGLEIMAGMSFVVARDDLDCRGLLDVSMHRRLTHAFRQEIKHACQVRRMLIAVGIIDKRELTAIMHWLNAVLDETLADLAVERRPYLRILLNHLLEGKLLSAGNDETWFAVQVIAGATGNNALLEAGRDFHETVAREEPDHIQLDAELIAIYAKLYPQVERDAAMKALRSRGTPFRRAIRAKREFVKAASALAADAAA